VNPRSPQDSHSKSNIACPADGGEVRWVHTESNLVRDEPPAGRFAWSARLQTSRTPRARRRSAPVAKLERNRSARWRNLARPNNAPDHQSSVTRNLRPGSFRPDPIRHDLHEIAAPPNAPSRSTRSLAAFTGAVALTRPRVSLSELCTISGAWLERLVGPSVELGHTREPRISHQSRRSRSESACDRQTSPSCLRSRCKSGD